MSGRSLSFHLPNHDSQQVDLVFVVDCTGSMHSYIHRIKNRIIYIANSIKRFAFNVRLALVEYRDHPPEDETFVSRVHGFTSYNEQQVTAWVEGMAAAGGGDLPDAVTAGLYAALNLSFRNVATKICFWIGDAPPHGLLPEGDNFPQGDPDGHDPVQICHEMARRGIILYCVGCEPSLVPYREFFMALSHITGGQYIPLRRARLLPQIIVNATQEEVENENLMGHVIDHLHLEFARPSGATIAQLAASLHTAMSSNNNLTRRVRLNGRDVDEVTPLARQMSYMRTLPQLAQAMHLQLSEAMPPRRNELEVITTVDITSLVVVPERTCERLARRSMARLDLEARENEDVEMEVNDVQIDITV